MKDIRASTWILPLDEQGVSLETAGGKGANLAWLAASGYPVPPGFLIATAGYRAYVSHNNLAGLIQSTLAGLPAHDPEMLEIVSQTIRDQFAAGDLPPGLDAALRDAYAALGTLPVAVRSSATAEDLPEFSFAGQQDTFLNIVDADALLEAVVRCWSSLWTARAIGYRNRSGISHRDLALAVVVQEMVPAEAAGVLFTANPLNGKRSEMVIEAALGLGESLVSGRVEPDRYLVDATSGRIREKALGAKALSIRPRVGGGTLEQDEAAAASRQALPDEAIADLVRMGGQLARLFGAPQDVEWAWGGGQLHLLQSRPITALFPLPAGMEPEPLQVLISFAAVQGLLDPITPLGQDTIGTILPGAGIMFGYRPTLDNQNVVHPAGGRLWVNITSLLRNRVGRRLSYAFAGVVEPASQQALGSILDDPRLAVTGGPNLRTLCRILPVALPTAGRVIRTMLRPEAARARFQHDLEAQMCTVEGRCARADTLAHRVAALRDLTVMAFPFVLPRFIPCMAGGMASLNLLLHLARELPDGEHDALAMTRGLPHNVTTEMDLDLWQAAVEIRADAAALAHFQKNDPGTLAAAYLDGNLPVPAQVAVASFLERYGMRGLGEIDLGRPRWREDPAPIMQTLQSYLQIEDARQAPDAVFARGTAAAQAAIEHLVEGLRATRGGWFKTRRARWAARRMRALAGLRESPKFWVIRVLGYIRAGLLDSGGELVEAGLLNRPEDLFFLRLAELEAMAAGESRDWAALVQDRRADYAREARRTQIPRVLLSDGQAFYEGIAAPAGELGPEGVLTGSPVSPGLVEGKVRIVLDPNVSHLAPGEILVCPGTDPAWTPLFLVASGLVMEVGGLMTHGSVVAREYGIPAVVGVTQVTKRLQTGQRVRVDGSTGQVTILDHEPAW